MGTPAVAQALRVPGRLVKDPTDLGIAFPYGGTALGLARDVAVRISEESQKVITASEWGGGVQTVIKGGTVAALAWGIRGADEDALATVFPNTFTSSGTWLREPGSFRAGRSQSSRAIKLLFAPEDAAQPGVIFYRAVPSFAEEVELRMGALVEMVWAVSFLATRDATDRMFEVAPLAEMTAP